MDAQLGTILTVTVPVICTVLGGLSVSLRRMGQLEQLSEDHAEQLRDVHAQVHEHVANYLVHKVTR